MKKSVLLLIAVMLAVGCSEKKEQQTKAPTSVRTEVVTAQTGVNEQSYVGIVEEREATAVSFTGMGVVKRMLVNEGQTVRKGQLLAEIDDTQARNMLKSAEASMTQANDALQRYSMLHDNGSLPEVKWVEIQSNVAQAKAQLEVARKNLSDCRLIAPVNGIIGRKLVSTGETALPSQAVVSILDISSVKVRVSIPEAEISGIGNNTASTITVDAINEQFNGEHIEKGVQADALTHTYDIRIHVQNNARKLLPGMVASVKFMASTTEQAGTLVTIPITSVQKKADGTLFVWTISKDSTAHRTEVSIGAPLGNRVVVTSGISEQQRIVTEGYQKLSDGSKVKFEN